MTTTVVDRPASANDSVELSIGAHILVPNGEVGAALSESHARSTFAPLPRPALLRHVPDGLIGRELEVELAVNHLREPKTRAIGFSGRAGSGKTQLLARISFDGRLAELFPDGILHVSARRRHLSDMLVAIFGELFTSDKQRRLPTPSELRGQLRNQRVLVLMDDVDADSNLGMLIDAMPQSKFVFSALIDGSQKDIEWMALPGLSPDDATLLIEDRVVISSDPAGLQALHKLIVAIEGNPARIKQIPYLALALRTPPEMLAEKIKSVEDFDKMRVAEIERTLYTADRHALVALTMFGEIVLENGKPEISLIDRGLVETSPFGWQVIPGLRESMLAATADDRLRESAIADIDFAIRTGKVIEKLDGNQLADATSALDILTAHKNLKEMTRLARLFESSLIETGAWERWEAVVTHVLEAARERSEWGTESWALHELGTRALCLGDLKTARECLSTALDLRTKRKDLAGAAVTQQNLELISPAGSGRLGVGALLVPAVVIAVLVFLGAIGVGKIQPPGKMIASLSQGRFFAQAASPRPAAAHVATFEPVAKHEPQPPKPAVAEPTAVAAAETAAPRKHVAAAAPPSGGPAVIAFSVDRPTVSRVHPNDEVCYGVSNALLISLRAHTAQGTSLISPAQDNRNGVITCRRVTPTSTTTYELSALGTNNTVTRTITIAMVQPPAEKPPARAKTATVRKPDVAPVVAPSPADASATAPAAPVAPASTTRPPPMHLIVKAAPHATKAARVASAPRPTIARFSVLPAHLVPGAVATICVRAVNAQVVRVDQVGRFAPNLLGCRTVTPARTTTYTLTVLGRDGRGVIDRRTVTVLPKAPDQTAQSSTDATSATGAAH